MSNLKEFSENETKNKLNKYKELDVSLVPKELTDDEVKKMWAKYPNISFEDFFPNIEKQQ